MSRDPPSSTADAPSGPGTTVRPARTHSSRKACEPSAITGRSELVEREHGGGAARRHELVGAAVEALGGEPPHLLVARVDGIVRDEADPDAGRPQRLDGLRRAGDRVHADEQRPVEVEQHMLEARHGRHCTVAPVRIAEARAYRQWQPFGTAPTRARAASPRASTPRSWRSSPRTGRTGFGEAAPLGAFYAPAFPAGVRAGVGELLPLVIGADATAPRSLLRRLDAAMMGQPASKSAIDMAACDLAARLAGVPLAEALGGRDGETVELYRSVVSEPPAAMAERARRYAHDGYRRIQVKVGADPLEDAARLRAVREAVGPETALVCDANGSWAGPPRCASCRRRAVSTTCSSSRVGRSRSARSSVRARSPARARRVGRGSRVAARGPTARRRRRRDDQARSGRRRHARGAAARRRLRARAARHGGGHRRQRHRNRRDGARLALDPCALAPAHGRLQRLGDGLERVRHARPGGRLARHPARPGARRGRGRGRARRAVRPPGGVS